MTKSLLTLCVIASLLSTSASAGWMAAQEEQIPANVIVVGQDSSGQPLYICRAQYAGGLYPGTLTGTSNICEIYFEGKEHFIQKYEVLSGGSYNWIAVYNGEIPFDALPVGKEAQGNILYICRGDVNSQWHLGKISRAYKGCSVPYQGKELKAPWYEVLVGNQ